MKFNSILVAPLFICARNPAVQARTDRRNWDDKDPCKSGDFDRAAWRLRLCRRYRTRNGAVQGMVTTDANGGRSLAPDAKVSLNGPTPSGTSADTEGKSYSAHFNRASYMLKSEASGMTATQGVVVTVQNAVHMSCSTFQHCGSSDIFSQRNGVQLRQPPATSQGQGDVDERAPCSRTGPMQRRLALLLNQVLLGG